ncbi:BRE1 E3 ubiquitin ligase-domain-containing protein [Kockovaella imperatae]|uniref:E3 ubiquitin protein ligase n=1 Tax=Kockovaella imperatae TaxID=4999 RepID=A0A1Y1URH8_9TREE|nr:BRE1 E3 ubiquitin ligase-domain-containing protein [Kockovaella imperatae]ORX40542.1 BRE1 E3 ubiquitin ligase-domain-containing protein [Kockovaella imperatae]
MNADLKRVRESGVDDGPSPLKRRATGLASPPPAVNLEDAGLEEWQKVMETHRKEAIYRQMLENRRREEAERRRADEIKLQEQKLQASVQAVEICWNQLVAAVRSLCPADKTNVQTALEPVLDPSLPHEHLKTALESRLPATTHLVETILKSNPNTRPSSDEIVSRSIRAEAEASTMRANVQKLQSQIVSLSDSSHNFERDLLRAQKALDRQRMEHDKRIKELEAQTSSMASPSLEKIANGSGHATPNGKAEDPMDNQANGPTTLIVNSAELEAKADSRLKLLETLRAEHTALQQECDQLRLLVSHPTEAMLRQSPFFQVYLQQLAIQMDLATGAQQRFEASEQRLDRLTANNQEFQNYALSDKKAETDVLRQQNARKDADLARIRGLRDDAAAELAELKAKEIEKMNFAGEMEKLANARADRIQLLSSEVTRLKGKLGAEAGSAGYLSFLRGDGGIDGDYVKDLEEKLQDLRSQVSAISQSNNSASESLQADLEAARRTLSRYERVLGPNPEAVEDIQQLAQKLDAADKENAKLKLQLSEAEASTNALYTEVEGLSKLWEGLDKTAHSKVFDLKDTELKMGRLATEKAKADNKYFQAMRTKEAIDVECKTAQRSVEKQLKMLDKAQEVEKALNAQLATHEKGLTALKTEAMDLQRRLASVSSEKIQLETRLSESQSSLADAQAVMRQRVAAHAAEKSTREKLEEEVESNAIVIKRYQEREERAKTSGGAVFDQDQKDETEKLWAVLKCQSCKHNMRSKVINGCYHTFCAPCLDSRIETRQRKCPACGRSFAKEDVHTIFWQ